MDVQQNNFNRYLAISGVIILAVIGIGYALVRNLPANDHVTDQLNTDTAARARYAVLYEAAWRADQGQGNVLMTATLLLPSTIAALGADDQRSDLENQSYRLLRDLPSDRIAFFLTLDSVSGPVADAAISDSLELRSDPTRIWSLVSWTPLIKFTAPGNSNLNITPQNGVAIFTGGAAVDWDSIKTLTLTGRNISDQPVRNFIWASPARLNEIEP